MERNIEIAVLRIYSAAVALNNMGVDLLEQQCFAQAHAIFKTAIHVMKAVTSPSRQLAESLDTDFILRQAVERLNVLTPTPVAFLKIVAGDDDVSELFCRSRDLSQAKQLPLFPLRIDDLNALSNGEIADSDLDATCILHNYGLSFICSACTSQSLQVGAAAQRLAGANRLLHLANSVVEGRAVRHGGQMCHQAIVHLVILNSISVGNHLFSRLCPNNSSLLDDMSTDENLLTPLGILERCSALLETLRVLGIIEGRTTSQRRPITRLTAPVA